LLILMAFIFGCAVLGIASAAAPAGHARSATFVGATAVALIYLALPVLM
jgi:hypothetical protein